MHHLPLSIPVARPQPSALSGHRSWQCVHPDVRNFGVSRSPHPCRQQTGNPFARRTFTL